MLLLLALLFAAPAHKDPGRALARRVQSFYAHTKDFSARFAQRYTYVAMGRSERETARLDPDATGAGGGLEPAGITGTPLQVSVTGRFLDVQDFMYTLHRKVAVDPVKGKVRVGGRAW